MRKFFLFALAVTMLTSCDYFKGSSNKEDETEEEAETVVAEGRAHTALHRCISPMATK